MMRTGPLATIFGALALAGCTVVHQPPRQEATVHDEVVRGRLGHIADEAGYGPYVVFPSNAIKTDELTVARGPVSGVESPAARSGENYFADAWKDAREKTAETLGTTADKLPRDAIALAINASDRRSQDRLHIHSDQLDPQLGAGLKQQLDAGKIVAGQWKPIDPVYGHPYAATWVPGESFTFNPFKMVYDRLVAEHGEDYARTHMGHQSIAVVAESGGFIVINGQGFAEEWLSGHAHAAL